MVTPINSATELGGRGQTNHVVRGVLTNGGGLQTNYHITNPEWVTTITMAKNGETATVEITTDIVDEAGVYLTDLEDTDVIWVTKSSGTTDYQASGTRGIRGVRVSSTPAAADVDYSINQVRQR